MPPLPLYVTPSSGNRGCRYTVTILGDALFGVTDCSFGEGIDMDEVAVVSGGEVRAKIRILPNASTGPKEIVLGELHGTGVLLGGFQVL